MNKYINIFYWVLTTFFFVVYWTQVGNWYNDGVELYGIIGAGIAANGAFIGNIVWTISTKNAEYKAKHGGKDMPFVASLKHMFTWK